MDRVCICIESSRLFIKPMFADWRRRFEKREAALAHIQQTDDFKASADTMENIPDPKDKCSKRAWEYKLKELRVRIRSLKPDETES